MRQSDGPKPLNIEYLGNEPLSSLKIFNINPDISYQCKFDNKIERDRLQRNRKKQN